MSFSQKINLYRNRHYGERCVIVCNGPSLKRMDLGFLKNETVIGLNKIFLGFNMFRFYPRYYVAVNQKVIEQSTEQISSLNCVKFISDRAGDTIRTDALTNIVSSKNYNDDFSFDISKGLQEGYTVTYAALQIAFYLGFTRVVIIGMDHRFSFDGKPNEEKLLEGDDQNHFAPSYFRGQKWDNPDLVNSEKYYEIANRIYKKHDRVIVDATLDGACQVFEKEYYKNIFKEIRC